MSFIISKIVWSLLIPANLMAVFFALWGLCHLLKWLHIERFMLACALTILIAFGVLPFGPNGLHYLETRYEKPHTMPPHVDGILVLGGAVESGASVISGKPEFNDGVDRVLAAMQLARLYPQAKIVFSGGSGLIRNNERVESVDMKIFLKDMGFNTAHVIYEDKSRTTYENIRNSFVMQKPEAKETWILITSACHMQRALGVADKFMWRFIPYPVDYRGPDRYFVLPAKFDVIGNLYASQLTLRETIGMAVYKMTGKMI